LIHETLKGCPVLWDEGVPFECAFVDGLVAVDSEPAVFLSSTRSFRCSTMLASWSHFAISAVSRWVPERTISRIWLVDTS
jgi:hypothetical protein